MSQVTRTTDPKGRLSLPKSFANTTVIIERISDAELRIRKARIIPEDELQFPEELDTTSLTDRDRDAFLTLLDRPPRPNRALRQAVEAYRQQESGDGSRV